MLATSPPVQQSHWKRYQQVISVLVKYGFEDVIAHPPFNRLRSVAERFAPSRNGKSVLEYSRYERIRMVCEELGTTFIKFAQIASNRPDILPRELIEELTKFQDQALPVPESDIRQILKVEYKRPLSDFFESIDYQPIASASISQVHRARTIGGQEVVLKIQRPNISENIEADIAILKNLTSIIEEYFPEYAVFQPKELVKMFETSIRKELKFTAEAGNIVRFQKMFAENEDIYVPSVFPEYTTNKILCMEYIEGFKITDLSAIEAFNGMTGKELAKKGIDLYFEQVFVHGFFHADPHPGNIFLHKDSGKICFIDFGMMGHVREEDQEIMAELLLALSNQDVQALKAALLNFSDKKQLPNEQELEQDIIEFFATYSDLSIEALDSDEVLRGLNSMFFDYKIKVPPNLLLLLKALIIIEGVGLEIDPKYNIVKNIDPFARRLLMRKFLPKNLKTKATKTVFDYFKIASTLPNDIAEIVQKIKAGKLHVEFEHKGLQPLLQKMETISNRIAFTLLLSSMILGSSLIVIAKVPPFVYNVSLIGFIGFGISGLLALRLVYSILKHGDF